VVDVVERLSSPGFATVPSGVTPLAIPVNVHQQLVAADPHRPTVARSEHSGCLLGSS
jgi:hypothetical protein